MAGWLRLPHFWRCVNHSVHHRMWPATVAQRAHTMDTTALSLTAVAESARARTHQKKQNTEKSIRPRWWWLCDYIFWWVLLYNQNKKWTGPLTHICTRAGVLLTKKKEKWKKVIWHLSNNNNDTNSTYSDVNRRRRDTWYQYQRLVPLLVNGPAIVPF